MCQLAAYFGVSRQDIISSCRVISSAIRVQDPRKLEAFINSEGSKETEGSEISARVYAHTDTRRHTHIRIRRHAHTNKQAKHIYTCTHAHTHTHTHTHSVEWQYMANYIAKPAHRKS